MKIPKKSSTVDGAWAKVGTDIKDGDRIQIRNAGVIDESGSFGPKHVFKVMTEKKEEFNLSVNRTSLSNLAEGFGEDTENWIGKVAKAFVIRQMVSDSLKNVLYLAPEGWAMDDDGKFFDPNASRASSNDKKVDINPDDIPF